MKKQIIVIALALIVVIVPLAACAKPAPTPTPAVELKGIMAWPTHQPHHRQFHEFFEWVNQRAKERGIPFTLEKVGGPEVIGARDQFKAMRAGTVDMVYTAGGYFSGETIELSALPCIKPEPSHQSKALRETNALDVMSEAAREKSGGIALAYVLAGGGMTLLSTKPVNGADWSGLNVRSFSKQTAMGITELGGTPTSIPAAELYEALQRGIVDAAIGTTHDRWAFGERGVYKYIIRPSFFGSSGYWFISAKVWDGLPSDVKSLLKDVAHDIQEEGFDWISAASAEAQQNFVKEDGTQIVQLSPEDQQKVGKAFRWNYLKWVGEESPDYGARLFELLKDYVY